MWSCRGTLGVVTSAPHPRFAFGKASAAVTLVGPLKCLDCLPPHILLSPPSWSSSRCSVTATSTPPSSHPLSWHLTASRLQLIFRSIYKNPPRLRPSFWPSLMPFWHTHRRPLIRVSTILYPFLLSGTASFPGTARACRSTLSLPSSG